MKYSQGKYTIKNPSKYAGSKTPTFRSSWESHFMQFCDNHPSVIQWASESIQIPYFNPLTQKNTIYVPDFFVVFEDANGKRKGELIEIKPSHETTMEAAGNNPRNQAMAIINQCKWAAAQQFCKNQGITFRVLTEHDMFHAPPKKPRKPRARK